jgi:hypothetical protein
MYAAPRTYTSKSDAQAFLSTIHADLVRETWKAPRATGLTVDDYGTRWIDTRPRLKESTRTGYRSDWDNHVAPWIGGYALEELTPDMVREWYGALGKELARKLSKKSRTSTATRQDGRSTVARSYRILHAVMATATEDGLIPSNPCRVKGGGTYDADERPTLTVQEVEALVAEVPDRYSCLVIALAWTAIRIGEATELRRGGTGRGAEGNMPRWMRSKTPRERIGSWDRGGATKRAQKSGETVRRWTSGWLKSGAGRSAQPEVYRRMFNVVFTVAKNRHGAVGDWTVVADFSRSVFLEAPGSDSARAVV